MKRLAATALAAILLLGSLPVIGVPGQRAAAKTIDSAKADNVFFYAADKDGKAVLMDIVPLDALQAVAHGQEDGSNYYYSSTDNYPTTQYCEARGMTIPEMVDFVAKDSAVAGSDRLSFQSGDSLAFMATDSYGNYTRSWSYDDLYGSDRYYFEGLYDGQKGWKTSWETAGTDNAKFGVDLDTYNAKYKDTDPYYNDKRAAFATGVPMPVLLATASFSGRTTTETLTASTEAGIAAQIAANGGTVAGSLKAMLSDDTALRLCIPITEADLMAAHRTAYDNFKWIYNMKLSQASSSLASQGTVAAPAAAFTQSGNTLTITVSCETPEAQIFYSFDGAPQQPYKGPITYDTKGADLTQNPVTLYLTAVKPGYDDAGVVTIKYPQSGVVFQSIYSASTGQEIVFPAEGGVTDKDWKDWTANILGISVKKPSSANYETLPATSYRIDDAKKTLTFAADVGTDPGAYSFLVYSKGFANKRLSVSLKNTAPALADVTASYGSAVTIPLKDEKYQTNVYLYITPKEGEKQLLSSGYVDRSVPGQVTIKAAWFQVASCPIKEAGTYALEVTNNSYAPVSQTIQLHLVDGKVFEDVGEDQWFAGAVRWATERQLFNGVSETRFDPNGTMTRAMFATVLWRACGSPALPAQTQAAAFRDVKAGTWYADAVAWASARGFVNGYGDGLFGVDDPVTREQIAVILQRYTAEDPARAALAAVTGDLSSFADAGSISDWARKGMQWAVGIDMIHGVSATQLDPRGLATRAQVATMFMNYESK